MATRKGPTGPVEPRLSPQSRLTRIKGSLQVVYDTKRQKTIVKRWPKPRGTPTPAQWFQNMAFRQSQWLIKNSTGEDMQASYDLAKKTLFLARDLRMKASYGTLYEVHFRDGTIWRSRRLTVSDIQAMLDQITNTPGSILFRATDGWHGLDPGTDGQLLKFDAGTGGPVWVDFTDDVQDILNQLSPSAGDVILFDGAAWAVLARGPGGDVLTIDNVTNLPTWSSLPAPPAQLAFHPGLVTGRFYTRPLTASITTAGISTGTMYALPIFIPQSCTLAKVMVSVTTLLAASTITLALYDDVGGQPKNLIQNFGTISGAATGDITKTVSQAVSPGWYWLALSPSANGISIRVASDNSMATWFFGTSGAATNQSGVTASWTYSAGNMPSSFPTISYNSSNHPLMWFAI